MTEPKCRACELGIPMIWFVQGKKYMHEAPGLSVTSCERIEAELRAKKAKVR